MSEPLASEAFRRLVSGRRMTRNFRSDALPAGMLERWVDLASRAPSAGKTQGWRLIVLEGDETERFWSLTLPPERRGTFTWQGLLRAPVIALPVADVAAYTERYSEPDKARTGLGAAPEAWPTPFWTVDTAMSMMTLLLAAEADGVGALLFGVFNGHDEVRAYFNLGDDQHLLGALAFGYPAPADERAGRSAHRNRRAPADIISRGPLYG